MPEAEIDFRPGGVFDICMRSPQGEDFWTRGKFLEVTRHARLVFTGTFILHGQRKFTARTTVTFVPKRSRHV